MKLGWKMLGVILMAQSAFCAALGSAACKDLDGSFFTISDEKVTVYDALFDETFAGSLTVVRNAPYQFKLDLVGSQYFFTKDRVKERLFHVYESSSATTRRFYCPEVKIPENVFASVAGDWISVDQSLLTIDSEGFVTLADTTAGHTIERPLEVESVSRASVKFRVDKYYLFWELKEPNKVWVYYQGKNRLFIRQNRSWL